MRLASFKYESGFLKSKVARRVFVTFAFCALVPMSTLAVLSYLHVRKNLRTEADRRQHQMCKVAGNTVVERLYFIEADLKTIGETLSSVPEVELDPLVSSSARLRSRFERIVLVADGDRVLSGYGKAGRLPELSAGGRTRLENGRSLVVTEPVADGFARVYLVLPIVSVGEETGQMALWGEIQGGYLWEGEGFVNPWGELLVVDESGKPLFVSSQHGITDELRGVRVEGVSSGDFSWSGVLGDRYLASYWDVFIEYPFGTVWTVVHSEREALVLAPLSEFTTTFALLTGLTFLLVLLLSSVQIRRYLVPIEILKAATRRIAVEDFASRVDISSGDELEELGTSFNNMAASLQRHLEVMHTLNEIGVSLTAERETDRLLRMVLRGARTVSNAGGAAIYLLDPEGELELSNLEIDSLDLDGPENHEEVPGEKEWRRSLGEIARVCLRADKTLNLEDVYAAKEVDPSAWNRFDRALGYRTKALLSVPLENHEGDVIGVLELLNARDETGGTSASFSEQDQQAAESLASQAAVALTKNNLVQSFRSLFEGLTELIATAIDEKSPYTYGHCQRVPILTMMLADAACNAARGPLKDFGLTEDERYELKVAALLHDCGKVTTPVHVVDKATKLEKLFDRIELVETRFEVLKREMEIELLKSPQGGATVADDSSLRRKYDELAGDLGFLRRVNFGVEFMPLEERQKVVEIANKYRWSPKPGQEVPILTEEEVHNLTIPKGTLNPEERNIVNEHVVATIRMLEKLPYPKNLQNVPFLAGAHHERMDGKGYPAGLTAAELPLRARIIGIADVFEALTAKDRPYKPGRKLSETMRIMTSMKDEGHIDPDLFDVFVKEQLHLRYALQYLDPAQVDIEPETEEDGLASAA